MLKDYNWEKWSGNKVILVASPPSPAPQSCIRFASEWTFLQPSTVYLSMCLVTILSETKRDWKANFTYSQRAGKTFCLSHYCSWLYMWDSVLMFRSCCCRSALFADQPNIEVLSLGRFWIRVRWRSDLKVLLFPPSLLHATVQPLSYNIAWRCFFRTCVIEIVFGLANIQLSTLALCRVSLSVTWQKFHFCWGLSGCPVTETTMSVPRRPQEWQHRYRSGGLPISLSQRDSRSSQYKKRR